MKESFNAEQIISMVKRLYLAAGGDSYYDEPLVSFASADDEWYRKYKTLIGPFHWTPEEALPQVPVALGQAMATYAAQNYGAGRLGRIRAGVRASVVVVFAVGVAMTVLALLFGDCFVAAFLSERAPEMLAVGRRMLWVTAPFFVPLGLIFIFRNTLQGIGRSMLPMLAGVVEMAMRAGVALGLLRLLGVNAVYWGDPAAWVGAAALLLAAYCVYSRGWPHEREPEPCP